MAQHGALATLKDLAEKEVDDAVLAAPASLQAAARGDGAVDIFA